MSADKNPKQSLVASFMQFLNEQLGNNELTDDAKESIEGTLDLLLFLPLSSYPFALLSL